MRSDGVCCGRGWLALSPFSFVSIRFWNYRRARFVFTNTPVSVIEVKSSDRAAGAIHGRLYTMKRTGLLLAFILMISPAAAAQVPGPPPAAIGIWNSSQFGFVAWQIGAGGSGPTAGNKMWQFLPPDLTGYYTKSPANKGELLFRGFEISASHFNPMVASFASPRLQLRDTSPYPGVPNRSIPGNTVFVDFLSVPAAITGGSPGGSTYRICYDLGSLGSVAATTVDPVTGVGRGLMFVWEDFQSTGGNNLYIVSTSTESPVSTKSYSGGSLNTGQNFILPNTQGGAEFCITWLFDQSMIQPVRNVTTVSANGSILGGGTPFATHSVTMDDGRGALSPAANDTISFSCNTPFAPSAVWIVPFILFSGTIVNTGIPGVTDPFPETWSTGNAYIRRVPVSKWIDDLCILLGAAPVGSQVSPNGANFAMWAGLDAPNFVNITVAIESLAFADLGAGYGGLSSLTSPNPGAFLGRNEVATNLAAYYNSSGASIQNGTCEARTLLCGAQNGWTPVGAFNPPTQLGFGVVPALFAGQFLTIQCWVLDANTLQIIDTTNAAVIRF